MGWGKARAGGRKEKQREEWEKGSLFEMDIIYLKIFLLKFGITVFLSFSGKKVPWLVGFVDPSLSPHAVTCRCHHWPGGRHLYSREMNPFRFCLREQPMHLAGNCIHRFKLAFHFSISSSGDLAQKRRPALPDFPASGSLKMALSPSDTQSVMWTFVLHPTVEITPALHPEKPEGKNSPSDSFL